MKKIIHQSLLFLLLLLMLSVIRFPYSEVASGHLETLTGKARSYGVLVSIRETSVHFPGSLNVQGLEIVWPTAELNIPITIEQIKLHPRFLSLLLLRALVSGESSLYTGRLTAGLSSSVFGGNVTLKLDAEELSLDAHPLISQHGGKGIFEFRGEMVVDPNTSSSTPLLAFKDGDLEVIIRDGAYPGGYKVAGIVPLPSVQDVQLLLSLRKRGSAISLMRASLHSSLGGMSGGGTILLEETANTSAMELEFSIELSPSGTEALAGYLALAAGISPEGAGSNWKLSVKKSHREQNPRIILRPQA